MPKEEKETVIETIRQLVEEMMEAIRQLSKGNEK